MTESGLKAVFLAERPVLLRLLTARLGNRDDAEDALQDIWVKLDSQDVREPIAQPAPYLYRMAANLATDRRLAAARAGARETAWHDVQPSADELPDAERAMLGRERLRQIEATVATMPERMRVALRLYRVEDQPQKEIARRLGMTVSGVEKLLRRATLQIAESRIDENITPLPQGRADSEGAHRLSGKGDGREG